MEQTGPSEYLYHRTRAVTAMHGRCQHLRTTSVHEMMDGKTVWQGNVEEFTLLQHSGATKAFAWGWDDNGEVRYIAVANVPPINSPREAVQAALASGKQR
jgi:hypothetical protein